MTDGSPPIKHDQDARRDALGRRGGQPSRGVPAPRAIRVGQAACRYSWWSPPSTGTAITLSFTCGRRGATAPPAGIGGELAPSGQRREPAQGPSGRGWTCTKVDRLVARFGPVDRLRLAGGPAQAGIVRSCSRRKRRTAQALTSRSNAAKTVRIAASTSSSGSSSTRPSGPCTKPAGRRSRSSPRRALLSSAPCSRAWMQCSSTSLMVPRSPGGGRGRARRRGRRAPRARARSGS